MKSIDRYRERHADGFLIGRYKAFRDVVNQKGFGEIENHIDLSIWLNMLSIRSVDGETKKGIPTAIVLNREELEKKRVYDEKIPYLKVLDIGGGTGESFLDILTGDTRDRIAAVDYVDVSRKHADMFMENMHNAGIEKKIRSMNLQPWEDFSLQGKYHVILALHSWYGVPKEPEHLRKLVNCLEPDGSAYIVLARKGELWDRLGNAAGMPRLTGADITQMLIQENIGHEVRPIYDTQVRVSELFKGKLTDKGKAAASYILMRDYKGLSQEEKEKVSDEFWKQAPGFVPDDLIIIPGKKE